MTPWVGLAESYGAHVTGPHPWQARALPLVLDALTPGRAPLAHVATGAGKSVLLAEVLRCTLPTLPPDAVAVVSSSRTDLVNQLSATFARRLGRTTVGRYDGRVKRLRRVVVTCNPSMGPLAEALDGRPVGLWVADEAHNITSAAQWAAVAAMAPTLRLGMTATPYRRGMSGDRPAALAGWDEEPVVEYRVAEAERDGVLVPALPVLPDPDMHGWQEDDAGIELIRRHAPAGPGIVSAVSIPDAEAYAARLTAEGIPAAAYHAEIGGPQRARLIARLVSGDLRCLVHPLALTEGVDIRELTWCLLRAMRGPLDLAQEVGRVVRACPERGKRYAVVLDPHRQLEQVGREHDAHLIESLQAQVEAEREERRARAERAEVEREQARVLAVSRQSQVVRQWAALAASRGLVDLARPGSWRLLPVLDVQRADLARLRPSTRWLPSGLREAVHECIDRPDLLERGTAADVVALLQAVRARAAESHRRTGRWGWRWPADMSPIVPSTDGDRRA